MQILLKPRITSIDFLRGTIMIIMALDHIRDYLYAGSFLFDPLDLEKTTGVIFFTRWITHFCAPIFMMLAGTAAFLNGQKKSKPELAAFLLKRGLWLIFVEMIVVNFGWNFNITYPMFLFITIWALGVSMIVLAGLIFLPKRVILAISIMFVLGHDLFDGIHVTGNNLPAFAWAILHDQRPFFWHSELLLVGYPLIPLIAIMPLGYCLGELYQTGFDPAKRIKYLLFSGYTALGLFILIRWTNFYGDPVVWSVQKDTFFTFLSFIKVNKYPPSLLYCLMTLGPALLFLGYTERFQNRLVNIISVYGRVPMFYYLIHIYIIHLVALITSAIIPGQHWNNWIFNKPIWFTTSLKGYGFSLPVAYLIWITIVAGLYPVCKAYDHYKMTHKEKWWLSYL